MQTKTQTPTDIVTPDHQKANKITAPSQSEFNEETVLYTRALFSTLF